MVADTPFFSGWLNISHSSNHPSSPHIQSLPGHCRAPPRRQQHPLFLIYWRLRFHSSGILKSIEVSIRIQKHEIYLFVWSLEYLLRSNLILACSKHALTLRPTHGRPPKEVHPSYMSKILFSPRRLHIKSFVNSQFSFPCSKPYPGRAIRSFHPPQIWWIVSIGVFPTYSWKSNTQNAIEISFTSFQQSHKTLSEQSQLIYSKACVICRY